MQFGVILMMSTAASYAFQHTETAYQINGLCFYRYLAYALAVFFGYICLSRFKKYAAVSFFFALLAAAFSPIGQKAIELFPMVAPILAVLMGVTSILIVPSSRGRGFFEFLIVLILPAILAVSRIGGQLGLLATTKSIGNLELSVATVSVVGGYFYLRYATLANLNQLELLSNEANEKDVAEVSKHSNIVTVLTTLGASGIAAFIMIMAPIAADTLRATVAAQPLNVLALAFGAGLAVTTIFYIFQLSHKESSHV